MKLLPILLVSMLFVGCAKKSIESSPQNKVNTKLATCIENKHHIEIFEALSLIEPIELETYKERIIINSRDLAIVLDELKILVFDSNDYENRFLKFYETVFNNEGNLRVPEKCKQRS